jgi:hypothetical protein
MISDHVLLRDALGPFFTALSIYSFSMLIALKDKNAKCNTNTVFHRWVIHAVKDPDRFELQKVYQWTASYYKYKYAKLHVALWMFGWMRGRLVAQVGIRVKPVTDTLCHADVEDYIALWRQLKNRFRWTQLSKSCLKSQSRYLWTMLTQSIWPGKIAISCHKHDTFHTRKRYSAFAASKPAVTGADSYWDAWMVMQEIEIQIAQKIVNVSAQIYKTNFWMYVSNWQKYLLWMAHSFSALLRWIHWRYHAYTSFETMRDDPQHMGAKILPSVSVTGDVSPIGQWWNTVCKYG